MTLPADEAWAIERLNVITHNGAYLDAPCHNALTMNGGERAITIDEALFDWCMQRSLDVNFRHFRMAT